MVKITDKASEATTLDERCKSMFKIADEIFRDAKHEWADSHPHNVQRKYCIEMERADHPSGRKPLPNVGFSFWAVKPVNGLRHHEKLTRVMDIYPGQNKITVSEPNYLSDAVRLAENYERAFTREFTVEKNYQ